MPQLPTGKCMTFASSSTLVETSWRPPPCHWRQGPVAISIAAVAAFLIAIHSIHAVCVHEVWDTATGVRTRDVQQLHKMLDGTAGPSEAQNFSWHQILNFVFLPFWEKNQERDWYGWVCVWDHDEETRCHRNPVGETLFKGTGVNYNEFRIYSLFGWRRPSPERCLQPLSGLHRRHRSLPPSPVSSYHLPRRPSRLPPRRSDTKAQHRDQRRTPEPSFAYSSLLLAWKRAIAETLGGIDWKVPLKKKQKGLLENSTKCLFWAILGIVFSRWKLHVATFFPSPCKLWNSWSKYFLGLYVATNVYPQ